MKMRMLLLVCGLLVVTCGQLSAQHHNANYCDGKLYFKVKSSFPDSLDLNSPLLLPLVALYHMDTCYRPFRNFNNDTLERTYCLRFSDTAKTEKCMDTLRTLGAIEYVEQVPICIANFTPNDINGNQWAISKIQAQQAWDITKGSTNVVIAIIDNGVRTTHEDIAANLWVNTGEIPNNGFDDDFNGYTDDRNGYDVADGDGDPNPPTGISTTDSWNHGTHCAGIASAVTNNSKGVAGLGFNTKIMAVKCTRNSEGGNVLSSVDEGIAYAMRSGANIISMSFGSNSSSFTEQALINSARSKGIVMIAAAGNDNKDTLFYPAQYSGVIAVGATDQTDHKALFSNFGSWVDVMAPGVSIYSTLASGTSDYGSFSGTSMATPMVAGLAGLVLAIHPTFSPDQVETQLKNTADNITSLNPGFAGRLGAGRINAFKAVGGVNGIDETVAEAVDLKVYPNPFNDKIVIERNGSDKPVEMQCFDMQGRSISFVIPEGSNHFEQDFGSLAPGMYMLRAVNTGSNECYKLVKF